MMINKTHTKLIRMFLTNLEIDNLNIAKVSDIMLERSNLKLDNYSYCKNTQFVEDLVDIETCSIEDLENEEAIVNKANILRKRYIANSYYYSYH